MNIAAPAQQFPFAELDAKIDELVANKERWARTSVAERINILSRIKDGIRQVAEKWALTAAEKKQIPANSPLVGEEWISGPYAVMAACNAFMQTLSEMDGKKFVDHLPVRDLPGGQIAVEVVPHSIWDRLLLSGVKAEVWMQKGVTRENLKANTASTYDIPPDQREGAVALVLGAGNIAAITPLDCFHKLFVDHEVVILKMNPVNDYLLEFYDVALKPLVDFGALRMVRGGADVGEYLCQHPEVADIHITGAGASHDAIVWGVGEEGRRNKRAGTPRNTRRITSELGAVCPTIVVPGPWSAADISFQAEQIVSQKLHNQGFNCVACQVLVMPEDWQETGNLLNKVEETIKVTPGRGLYYPGAQQRLESFTDHAADNVKRVSRPGGPDTVVVPFSRGDQEWYADNEVFAPAMNVHRIEGKDEEQYLIEAIKFANETLHGTLGGNILIHPSTIKKIGRRRFDEIVAEFRYGSIAINAWTGLGFLMVQTTWGAYPGHTLDDVQSGIGMVHNSFMFDRPERSVVEAPFRPFPRSLMHGSPTLLPRPPWFVTNKRQDKVGKLLTDFQYKPSWFKLPRIFMNALMG